MKRSLKNRIISGLSAFALVLSCAFSSGLAFGEEENQGMISVVQEDTSEVSAENEPATEVVGAMETDAINLVTEDKNESGADEISETTGDSKSPLSVPESNETEHSVDPSKTSITEADTKENDDNTEAAEDDTVLTRQSIELYPDETDTNKMVTLDGLMPEDASAEVVDVTDQSMEENVVAAYDITITDGETEYQPGEEKPISVEITDPRISEEASLSLWHILSDGSREEITDFTVEEGKISFDAAGFSVYEIVENLALDLLKKKGQDGFIVRFYFGKRENTVYKGPRYFVGDEMKIIKGNKPQGERTGLTIAGSDNDSTRVYFEKGYTNNTFYIYVMEGEQKRYLMHKFTGLYGDNGASNQYRSALTYADSKSDATPFTFEVVKNKFVINADGFYWVADDGTNLTSIVGYKGSNDQNLALMEVIDFPIEEAYQLDGRTYGLMSLTGDASGYALMAGDKVHTLAELISRQKGSALSNKLYVDEGSEITRWTFHSVGGDQYTLSGQTEDGIKYLAVEQNSLVLSDNPDQASAFTVTLGEDGRIRLSYNDAYISFRSPDFTMTSTVGEDSWLNLLDFAELSDENQVSYTADRISVSSAVNGQRVIVYTRIWNEDTKKYDIYAVDADGSLYPCYASGGKLLWLGSGTDSLEWIFTEYYDAVTKAPNYYYELYNPYSEKYLAPQLAGNQVLSDNTIGINMQGRRNGEFYSEIIAWDKSRYAYVGLRANAAKTALEPCAQSASLPFYFASIEDLEQVSLLNPVETVDNKEHGITIRMQDFSNRQTMSDFLGQDTYASQVVTKNLLSTNLGADGYPKATKDGRSLKTLYNAPNEVNHLFIQSVYNSSGYFEFDSCQNYATLCNPDGTLKTPVDGVTDFTVYKELGTTDVLKKSTLQHGQFLPYNIIKENRYASQNAENLYSALADPDHAEKGVLQEDDPRKYEKLHLISDKNNNDTANYQNGMELEASFVQTVSGLDAWGHDMIFEFTGDDDFWLYVDGELVIDLGGIHSALKGTVNFRTGEVYVHGTNTTLFDVFKKNYEARGLSTAEINAKLAEIFELNDNNKYVFKDYSSHTMKIFYMERGSGASNLHMRFNLASVTKGHVVVSKKVEGNGASDLDWDFIEYPFQIYYIAKDENDNELPEQLLQNNHEHIHVTYQGTNKPVTYVQKYRPPGIPDEDAYEHVYFINPSKSAEITFPDKTIKYRIAECAVDPTIYEAVKINGQEVDPSSIKQNHNLYSYYSELTTSEVKPSISFDNFIRDNVIKDLYFKKKLVDAEGQPITDDETTFNFRLYLSSVALNEDEIPLANMYKYYVLSPDKKICRFDPAAANFAATEYEYSRENIQKIKNGEITGLLPDDVTFYTSGFGAISGIPADYTVVVPGLPIGAVFKVTEDIKPGYGLLKYEQILGTITNEDQSTTPIPSYQHYESNEDENVGLVYAAQDPRMEVVNQKGFGLTVNKRWSDLNLTTAHQTIYTAVYVDGELLNGSVREIKSPKSSVYYFWPRLVPYANGDPRTNFDGYTVREVTLSNDNPTVAKDGTVTDYGTVTPVESGESIWLSATRTVDATPEGEAAGAEFEYVTTYSSVINEETIRTDTIRNTRKGGIAVRLFKWDSEVPLPGGTFTLKDSTGNIIDTYVSDSEGIVTMMYSFERGQIYTLTETIAPKGYIGLQKPVCFKINDDDSVSLYYGDGTTTWGDLDAKDIPWVKGKHGSAGITAFVDVYNKPFNFKIVKTNSKNPDMLLDLAHFALYKQINTSIGGPVKNKKPMSGFEDMVTENGIVYVCGGDSGRVIDPGESGSVYYLTETEAPLGYAMLTDDIIFRISALGVPSLISDSYNGQLVEEDESYTYTLSVPNVKTSDDKMLTIRKVVEGVYGNRAKDFNFSITVTGTGVGEELAWYKNGRAQEAISSSSGSFTMGHGDVVIFTLPEGAHVTVTEDSEDYLTTFKLGDSTAVKTNPYSFDFQDDIVLTVTNVKDGLVPTGVWLRSFAGQALALLFLAVAIGGILFIRNRRKGERDI